MMWRATQSTLDDIRRGFVALVIIAIILGVGIGAMELLVAIGLMP